MQPPVPNEAQGGGMPPSPAVVPSEQFNEGVSNLLMATEELRRSLMDHAKVTGSLVLQWQHELEICLPILESLARWTDDAVAELETDLFRHCQTKAITVAQQTFSQSLKVVEPDENDTDQEGVDIDSQRRDIQGALARLTEINLLLLENAKDRRAAEGEHVTTTNVNEASDILTSEEIIQHYTAYQRSVLRQRVKPAIAALVQERQGGSMNEPPVAAPVDQADDNEDDEQIPTFQQHHAPVLTLVLGQAAVLIHPLAEWKVALPADVNTGMVARIRTLCNDSIRILDEQAELLTKTVSDWFFEDRPVEAWMLKSAEVQQQIATKQTDLAFLDGLVEEMAFGCQVQARYQTLIESTSVVSSPTTIEQDLLPIWTWKYAALERYLAVQQWQSALSVATPVTIVIGTDICVPSVVEDAQYLSTRALERAASTRSTQAIGTVGHSVSHDVWSIELTGGVYEALIEQRGCWSSEAISHDHGDDKNKVDSPPKSKDSAFASALLDALDDDLGAAPAPATSPLKTPSAPSSGPFLGFALSGGGDRAEQIRLDTQFCVANGIHAASGACRSLVGFLDSLLSPDDDEDSSSALPSVGEKDKAMAMISLTREELFRYAEAYQKLLDQRISETIELYCGPITEVGFLRKGLCFVDLRSFFGQEDYNIDAGRFATAEEEVRLERELLGPLKDSNILSQLPDKCEPDVLRQFVERVVALLVELLLDCLWKTDKKFTDWGSLLLSKQVRMLQGLMSKTLSQQSPDGAPPVTTPTLLRIWERLSQVVTVLQLEKPSDWLPYQSTSILTPDELRTTLSLRTDFSREAIQTVVASVSKTSPG